MPPAPLAEGSASAIKYERMNHPGAATRIPPGPTPGRTQRPRRRPSAGAPGTAAALLQAARRLFARRGYDGASIRAITRHAQANLGAVTYHFGSKQELFNAVIASAIEPLRERVTRAARGPGSPLDRIEQVVRAFFDHLLQSPDMPKLIVHVLATGRRPPPAVASWIREGLGILSGLVREGQRDGSIRAGDPALMAVSVVSQPFHLSLVRQPLREAVAIDQSDASTRMRVIDHAVRFVRNALAAPRTASDGRRAPRASGRPRLASRKAPAAAGRTPDAERYLASGSRPRRSGRRAGGAGKP